MISVPVHDSLANERPPQSAPTPLERWRINDGLSPSKRAVSRYLPPTRQLPPPLPTEAPPKTNSVIGWHLTPQCRQSEQPNSSFWLCIER